MVALFRRHCFLIAAVLLLWQGWAAGTASSAPQGAPAGADAPPPPVFRDGDLERRASEASALTPDDPFFLRELMLLQAERELAAPEQEVLDAGGGLASTVEAPTVLLRLTLQSTLPDGPRSRAWINGQDLGIGDAVPGVAVSGAPILKAVQGSTVTIAWSGRDYLLDLYGTSALELPLPPEVQE